MYNENVKVFGIKARLNNGNLRTVQAIVPMNTSLDDVCTLKEIPILSIISVKVSEPQQINEAICYASNEMMSTVMKPDTLLIKSSFTVEVA